MGNRGGGEEAGLLDMEVREMGVGREGEVLIGGVGRWVVNGDMGSQTLVLLTCQMG